MRINVVVCTYDRVDGLKRTIQSLRDQTISCEEFGILVVDNGSSDGTAALAQSFQSEMPNLRYHFDPVPDLCAARNRGLEMTSSALIGYIDDDEEAAPNWVERVLENFARLPDRVVAVGGDLDPVWEIPRPTWLSDLFVHFYSVHLNWSASPRRLGPQEWLAEGNVAYRTEELRRFGGFSSELGRKGPLLLSGENLVMDLMMRSGLEVFFDPAIRVKHYIPASRLNKTWLRRRMFWGGVSAAEQQRIAKAGGVNLPYWTQVDVPQSPGDWLAILSADGDAASTDESLHSLFHLGYLLGLAGVVIGR